MEYVEITTVKMVSRNSKLERRESYLRNYVRVITKGREREKAKEREKERMGQRVREKEGE